MSTINKVDFKDFYLFHFFEDPSIVGFICQILPWLALIYWIIHTYRFLRRAKYSPHQVNYFRFESLPGVFTTIGLLGTFLGITYGLINFDTTPDSIRESIKGLLDGLKSAFFTSITGISLSLIYGRKIKNELNKNQKLQPPKDEQTLALERMETAINKQTESLGHFYESLADKSSNAIFEAFKDIINDVNDIFKNYIGVVVNENFKELTSSVDRLNVWQQENKNQIEQLTQNYALLLTYTKELGEAYQNATEYSKTLTSENGKLALLIDKLNSVMVDDPRFSKIIESVNESTSNLCGISDDLKETSKNYEEEKRVISTWLNNEAGVRESTEILSKKLEDLDRIKVEDLNLLHNSFEEKLKTTFASLDDLMNKYIHHLDMKMKSNNEKIKQN